MHYRSMLFVELPAVQKDPQWEQQVQERMEEVKAQHPGKIAEKVLLELQLGMLSNVRTTFGRELTEVIHKTMARFVYETDDPELLEFEDRTDEYLEGFNKKIVCVSMPDGRILSADDYDFMKDFKIQGGKVFQKKDGKLKRTITARRMRVLPEYPRSKLYKSFDEYVEDYGGCKNEETGRYGEWFNPYGICDWYSIGGRWPEMFLVKLDCPEYSYGECESMDDSKHPAPEGHRWVACARKKDIQWDAMRQWRNQQAEERFHKLEKMFQSGEADETVHRITEEGIVCWGDLIYRKGQTLEEYMEKYGIPDSWRYPISVCGIFIDEIYYAEGEVLFDDDGKPIQHLSWQEVMDNYIDDADDNTVFVGIDYHM